LTAGQMYDCYNPPPLSILVHSEILVWFSEYDKRETWKFKVSEKIQGTTDIIRLSMSVVL